MKAPRIGKSGIVRLKPVRMTAAVEGNVVATLETKSGNAARWIQVASEGMFLGHPQGPFEFDREVFDELVRNFRNHPSYELSADHGVGVARVIAFDFSHASEAHPSQIAVHGAPAQGWVLDLQVREDPAKGVQLWALAEFLDPVHGQIDEGRYAWTSVAVWPDATDPISGEVIGWYMSSIALTNDPFIQGMVPIAARRGVEAMNLSPERLAQDIKRVLGLPETSALDEIMGEVAKLKGFIANPDLAPPGVDVDDLLAEFRWMLNLPLLTTADEVVAELDKLMSMVSESRESGPATPEIDPAATTGTPAVEPTATLERKAMSFLKLLAGRFNIPADESEVQAHVVKALDAGQAASTSLSKLLGLLGVKNLEQAEAKLQELLSMKELMPTIEGLLGAQLEAETAAAEEDVEAVVAAYRVDPAAKPSFMAHRTGGVTDVPAAVPGETIQQRLKRYDVALEARRKARESFRESYPQAFAKPAEQTLLSNLATKPSRSPLDNIVRSADGGITLQQPRSSNAAVPPAQPGTQTAEQQAWAAIQLMPGRNHIEKTMNWLKAQPGGDKMSHEDVHTQACLLNRKLRPLRAV